MRICVNPGNDGFARILKNRYVDKIGLIRLANGVIGTSRNMVCVSRPRRFGKSFAAESLVTYITGIPPIKRHECVIAQV